MADFAAEMCIRFHREGLPFSLEHPGRSIARKLDKWVELQNSPGVSCTEHHHCMFEPCEKRKFQVLINNIEGFDEEIGLLCKSAAVCSRTHCAHDSFKHNVEDGKVTNFGTEGTSEYPLGLTRIQAKLTIAAVWKKGLQKKYSFIEIFSGPNAPLTASAREAIDEVNLRIVKESVLPPTSVQKSHNSKELTLHQKTSLSSGWQPKWNSGHQLIPDGLDSTDAHMRLAASLKHPIGESDEGFPDELWESARAIVERQ